MNDRNLSPFSLHLIRWWLRVSFYEVYLHQSNKTNNCGNDDDGRFVLGIGFRKTPHHRQL